MISAQELNSNNPGILTWEFQAFTMLDLLRSRVYKALSCISPFQPDFPVSMEFPADGNIE